MMDLKEWKVIKSHSDTKVTLFTVILRDVFLDLISCMLGITSCL